MLLNKKIFVDLESERPEDGEVMFGYDATENHPTPATVKDTFDVDNHWWQYTNEDGGWIPTSEITILT